MLRKFKKILKKSRTTFFYTFAERDNIFRENNTNVSESLNHSLNGFVSRKHNNLGISIKNLCRVLKPLLGLNYIHIKIPIQKFPFKIQKKVDFKPQMEDNFKELKYNGRPHRSNYVTKIADILRHRLIYFKYLYNLKRHKCKKGHILIFSEFLWHFNFLCSLQGQIDTYVKTNENTDVFVTDHSQLGELICQLGRCYNEASKIVGDNNKVHCYFFLFLDPVVLSYPVSPSGPELRFFFTLLALIHDLKKNTWIKANALK